MPYTDPARKRESDRRYREARRAELAAKQRAYYLRNREHEDARNREYLMERLWLARAIRFANGSNRRVRVMGLTEAGKLLGREVVKIVGDCEYCGGEPTGWDHVIPLIRGGANRPSNLVRCCKPCNREKYTRTPEEWRPGDRDDVLEILA